MKKVFVSVGGGYDVLISGGLLTRCGEQIEKKGAQKAAIITDKNVGVLYLARSAKSLEAAGFEVSQFTFEGGERHKNMATISEILEFLAAKNFTRSDIIVALGGGIVGDVAGFAAATYLRGVRFVQLPTTLLAAVDSSVGGKVGVNLAAGKNLAGAFHQPSLVLCDTETFSTLTPEIFADGKAEALKYGVTCDAALFSRLEGGDFSDISEIVAACVKNKAELVQGDELDKGERQLLNFGHTVGHAVEKCSDYQISHGQAVSIGMAVITRAAEKLGLTREPCCDRLVRALLANGLPTACPFKASELLEVLRRDKKRAGDSITLVLPERISHCVLKKIPIAELENFVASGLN